jgi:Zn-dependent M16 (insulinase) family peptidase
VAQGGQEIPMIDEKQIENLEQRVAALEAQASQPKSTQSPAPLPNVSIDDVSDLLETLHDIAVDYNPHDFGLPIHYNEATAALLRKAVFAWLSKVGEYIDSDAE